MKIKLLVLTIFLLYVESSADLLRLVSFNPGLKIGYEFGSRHGFLIGFESSLTYSRPYFYLTRPWGGIVGGIQFNVHDKHFLPYWEIEGGYFVLGMAFGGEWDQQYFSRYRVFGGLVGYLSYKKRINDTNREIALVGKYPYFIYEESDHGTYLWGKETGD
jgi:hypothetical protein